MYFAGVDLGASYTRAAVADGDGAILAQDERPTPRGPTGIAVTEAVLEALRTASDRAGIEPDDIVGAGIGSIGPLDLVDGVIENPANLPAEIGTIPLTGPIGNLINSHEVFLHNDTNAGVIGERFFSDRNPTDMVYLTISTGIGAGVCVDGNVLGGWDGNAGEVGHMMLDPDGRLTCGCGADGHWEAYCSGSNIPRYTRFLHEAKDFDTDLDVDAEDFHAADVFANADEDPLAHEVIDRVAHWNAMGVTNIVHSYAPIVIYVGGAVATNNPELTLEPIRDRIEDMVFTNIPDVQLTTLGDDVVLKGAIASAMTRGTGDQRELRT